MIYDLTYIKGDEEENDYLAPADSTDVALPAVDHASSAMETGPFETDESATTPPPHLAYRVTARMLCTNHTGTHELGESFRAAAARLGEPVRDDLYMLVDTVEQGEGSTPAAKDVGYGITYAWDDLVGAIQENAPTTMEGSIREPQISDNIQDTAEGDQGVTGSRPQAIGTVHTGTDCTEVMSDSTHCSSRMHSDLRGRQSPSTSR
nr:hypothetical protein [Tanacetum cinerariifolium]